MGKVSNGQIEIDKYMQALEESNPFEGIISKQDIRELLKKNINSISYLPLKIKGYYNVNTKDIMMNENLDENIKKLSIIHEMSHALSYRNDNSLGLRKKDENGVNKGTGMNEGITEYLAEKITGKHIDTLYPFEKSTYEIMKNFASETAFLKDYIYGTNEVETEILQNHGKYMLELYKAANTMLDKIAVKTLNYRNLDEKSINYSRDSKKIAITIRNSRETLDRVLDRMISINLKKSKSFFADGCLIEAVKKYPNKQNFKEFDLEQEEEKNNKKMDDWFNNMLVKETDEVTISQINKQTGKIRKLVMNAKRVINIKDKSIEKN